MIYLTYSLFFNLVGYNIERSKGARNNINNITLDREAALLKFIKIQCGRVPKTIPRNSRLVSDLKFTEILYSNASYARFIGLTMVSSSVCPSSPMSYAGMGKHVREVKG